MADPKTPTHAEFRELLDDIKPTELAPAVVAALRAYITAAEQTERERGQFRRLLGEFPEPGGYPEEPPTYGPDGYAVELNRVADALNDIVDVDATELPTVSAAVCAYLGDLRRLTTEFVHLSESFIAEQNAHAEVVRERDELKAKLEKITARRFPILGGGPLLPRSVPWSLLELDENARLAAVLREHSSALVHSAERASFYANWTREERAAAYAAAKALAEVLK